MKLKIAEKLKSISLREKGYSLNEIVKKVGVAKSSISTWVRNVPLTDDARERLLTKIKLGQLISAENKRARTQNTIEGFLHDAKNKLEDIKFDKFQKRLLCSLLYWCEGAKNHYSGVNFTNSDPKLIRTFLHLFREGFGPKEHKFRACVHLHKYHDTKKQMRFWAKVTNIRSNQFIKPYQKPNTGKRVRKNYPGCINIRYGNNNIARQLLTTAEAFLTKYGGMV